VETPPEDSPAENIGIIQRDSTSPPPTPTRLQLKEEQCDPVERPEMKVKKRVGTHLFLEKHGTPMVKMIDDINCVGKKWRR